jgi:hypothetical protein
MEKSFRNEHAQRSGARVVADAPETARLFLGELQRRHRLILGANAFDQAIGEGHGSFTSEVNRRRFG